MRTVIGGASGLIGTELARQLTERGDTVVSLVRREPRDPSEVHWNPATGALAAETIRAGDAVVNLSGASIGRIPWTRSYRAEILTSRVTATRTLAEAVRTASERGDAPAVFVSASAVGFYGSRPGETLSEASAAGTGFLADVVRHWEAAARASRDAQPAAARTVFLRTGVVIAATGTMAPLRLLTRLGLAGPIGGGRQFWPWISLHDEVAAIVHLIDSKLDGPVNVAGPTPATQSDVMRAIARQLHRPYGMPLPAPIATTLLGEAARELLLADQHVVPAALLSDGFDFRHPTIADALAAVTQRAAH